MCAEDMDKVNVTSGCYTLYRCAEGLKYRCLSSLVQAVQVVERRVTGNSDGSELKFTRAIIK